jgi:hypothetical protein
MIGSYIGIAVAFGFAVSVPGRAIPSLLAEDLPTALYVSALVALSVAVVFISLRRGEGRRIQDAGRRADQLTAAASPAGTAAARK